jgi:xylulokinase
VKHDYKRLYLGLDLGTSSLKAIAVDERGVPRGSAGAAYPILGMDKGKAEQDTEAWIGAMSSAARNLAAQGLELSAVAGIGLSGQMPTFVGVDAAGAPLAPAMLWCDARADEAGSRLLEAWGRERHYRSTGVILDGRYIAPMHAWFLSHRPSDSPACAKMLSAKDYLHLRLTGRPCTDPSTASGFGLFSLASGTWDESLCSEAGIDPRLLPELSPSGEESGRLTREGATILGLKPGIPVACGAADSVAGVLGMGAFKPGRICQMAGSSTALVALAEELLLDGHRRYLVTPLALPGSYGLEADILASGASLAWLAGLAGDGQAADRGVLRGEELARLTRLAENQAPGADGLFFFPYLAGGEQSVLWDPGLRGGLSGLSLRHGLGHLARSLYEGLCFEIRRCVAAFEDSRFAPSDMLCTGPISRESFYMQLLADVTGLECRASEAENASALGAAILGGLAAGAWPLSGLPSILPACDGSPYRPRPEAAAIYDSIYPEYASASLASRRGP